MLELLVLKGCVVTIDAMPARAGTDGGCQQEIASAIIDHEADYILAVKDNQKFLHDDIQEAFNNEKATSQHTTKELGHGRIEIRTTSIITNLDWICNQQNWKMLYCIIKVFATRIDKKTGEQQSATRYYDSKKANAE